MIWYLDLMWNARPGDTDARDLKIAEQASTIAELIRLNRQLTEVNSQLHERIERLEGLLASQVDSKSSKTPVFTENYSLGRNRHSPPMPPQSQILPSNRRDQASKPSSFCSGNWRITWTVCSCLLSTPKLSRPTIGANATLAEKPRFARELAPARQRRVRNGEGLS